MLPTPLLIQHELCCICFPIRMGLFMICLLTMILPFISIFSSAFRNGWWVLWIKFALSVIFSIVGFFSVYRLDYKKARIFLWWSIFVVCLDIVTAIYETTFYDEICESEYDTNSSDFRQCINKTSKIVTVTVKIISIILEIYFVHITRKFTKLLEQQSNDYNVYLDIEESAEKNFESVPVPTTPSQGSQHTAGYGYELTTENTQKSSAFSSLNLGITSNRLSEMDTNQYLPPAIPQSP
eukprot:301206_1